MQDAEIDKAKQTKARKAIEEAMKAVTALIKAGEFETEVENNHSQDFQFYFIYLLLVF